MPPILGFGIGLAKTARIPGFGIAIPSWVYALVRRVCGSVVLSDTRRRHSALL